MGLDSNSAICPSGGLSRHCEEPTGPRERAPDDRLRDEAIHSFSVWPMDCFASLAMTSEQPVGRNSQRVARMRAR